MVAEIPFDAAVTPHQMLVSARVAANEARQLELVQLMARIKEGLGATAAGRPGSTRCWVAFERGQIQTMVVDRNYRPPGWRCPDCDWAGLSRVERCPLCGGAPVPMADAVGELVRLAILQNSRVEVAEEIPAAGRDGRGGGAAAVRVGGPPPAPGNQGCRMR